MRTKAHLNGAAVFACLLWAGSVLGCVSESLSVYTCPGFDEGHKDALGLPDPCHDNDPPEDLDGCPGECIPPGPRYWSLDPILLWVGPKGQAPSCPHGALDWSWTGYGDLDVPNCECTCEAPTGSCTLPSTLTAHAAICQDLPQGQTLSFDAPANWNGVCSAANPIQEGASCGGVPCVQSLSVEPLLVVETGCKPVGPTKGNPRFLTEALACVGGLAYCEGDQEGRLCAPASDPPGFQRCIYRDGTDRKCPDTYPKPYVFYEDESINDQSACEPCACSAPDGSVCSAFLSVYKNSTCSTVNPSDLVAGAVPIASTGQGCVNILPAGQALGSKEISTPVYQPGTCAPSGGEVTGSVEPAGFASMYCCRD